jgi:valyl-tRNA synthetase
MIEKMPAAGPYDDAMLSRFDTAREIVSAIRTVRKEKNIPIRDSLVLCAGAGSTGGEFDQVIRRMCNLSEIRVVRGKVESAVSFRIHTSEFFIPLGEGIDHDEEIRKLREELTYTEGFLASVMAKLSNEKFVANAPGKVITLERKKEADARARIATLKESLSLLEKK